MRRRGRFNLGKRLAWVKKNFPEEVFIRTALLSLNLDRQALEDQAERVGVSLRRTMTQQHDLPAELDFVISGDWGMYSPIISTPTGPVLGRKRRNYDQFPETLRAILEPFLDPSRYRQNRTPIDPLVPWIARMINDHRKEIEREWRGGKFRSDLSPGERAARRRNLVLLQRHRSDLIDWFHGAHPQLPRTIPEALDASAVWHREMAEQLQARSKREAMRRLSADVVKRWKDGWTVRLITSRPGLVAVGESLGHCYASGYHLNSYYDEIVANRHRLYTLFDATGIPRVSMWVSGAMRPRGVLGVAVPAGVWKSDRIAQLRGSQNALPMEKYFPKLREFIYPLLGFTAKTAVDHLNSLGEAAIIVDLTRIKARPLMGKGADFFENKFGDLIGYLAQRRDPAAYPGPVFEAMERVYDILTQSYSQSGLDHARRLLPNLVDQDILFLGKGGEPASENNPTRKVVAQVAWNFDEFREHQWDYEAHWSGLAYEWERSAAVSGAYREMARKIRHLEEADLIEDLHQEAYVEADSKAWESSFKPLWGQYDGRWGLSDKFTGLVIMREALVSNFTDKFVAQVEAIPEDPLASLQIAIRDAMERWNEEYSWRYSGYIEDHLDEWVKKAGGLPKRVARGRRSRHHGVGTHRSGGRRRSRRRGSASGVSQWR